ncbi:MAG: D-alanyl-D-alanine carboxypeptidase/D-alanyl-D-alanine-endopeptidase [Fluviicola sp.]|nr:D-alanyl-D-alanine carboxypeptidase/D-alanyl-D-alanine-endopeptidase [Fluviicola sp.]
MKILSLFLLTLFYGVNLLFAQSSIQAELENFVNDPSLKHASVSFNLIDLESNGIVASYNPQQILPPASTAKLFSTATALEILGPDYRAKTRIYYNGEIDSNGVLNGNIWIRGGGDPSLGSKYFNSPEKQRDFLKKWVAEIKKLGIKEISGAVIADASEFGYNGAPDGWNWVDMGNYYGSGPSGLTVFDNLIQLKFKTSSVANQPAKIIDIQPQVPGLIMHNYVLSSKKRGDNSYIYGAPYSLDRFATGTLPVNQSEFTVKGSMPDPESQIAYELVQQLMQQQITVSDMSKSVRKLFNSKGEIDYSTKNLIYTHKGARLIDIIKVTNHRSINLFAEQLLCLVGYHKTGDGSTKSGLKVLENYWSSRINVQSMRINDGSGLSRTNAVSAANYTALLSYMSKSKNKVAFLNSLPISGESGTLKSLCRNQSAHGKVHAKSGTMTRIKSYSGYIHSANGKVYAFAIIVNNFNGSSSAVKKRMAALFNKIAVMP